MIGKLKSIIGIRSFGFIGVGADEYFFHKDDYLGTWSQLVEDANLGEIVLEFDPINGPKGLRAQNVERVIL